MDKKAHSLANKNWRGRARHALPGLLCGVLLAVPARAAVPSAAIQAAQQHVNLGQYVAELRDYDRAAQHFEQALAQAPRSKAVMFTLGALYQKMGAFDRAAAVYTNLLALYPKDADGFVCLGNARLLQEQLPAAIRAYETAIAFQPAHAVALRNLGFAYLRDGEPALAVSYLSQATKTCPTNALAWFDLGMAYFAAGQPRGARRAFRRGLQMDQSLEAKVIFTDVLDEQAGPELARAIAAYRTNNFAAAEAIVRGVTEAYPEYARAQAYRGHVFHHQRPARAAEAEEAYRAALAARAFTVLTPDDAAVALDNLGMLRLDASDFDGAEELFHQATLQDSRYPVAYFNYGLMLVRRGMFDAAAVAFADAARRDPSLLEYAGRHPMLGPFRASPAYSNVLSTIAQEQRGATNAARAAAAPARTKQQP
jgi:protein O-GlcNAc transferase